MNKLHAWPAALVLVLMFAANAAAQGPRDRTELSIGFQAALGVSLGSADVTETQPDGTPFVLFSTTSRLGTAPGAVLTLGRRLNRRLAVEAAGSLSFPTFETRISNDFEGADALTATHRSLQFTAEGAALVTVARGEKTEVFVRAGGGWMRQLSEDHVAYEDGAIAAIGGGVKYWWRDRPKGRPVGLRIDAGVRAQSGGLAPAPRAWRFSPAFAASVMMRF